MTPAGPLQVASIHLFRGDRQLLKGLSFAAQAGQCVEVTGANGTGKTSLLRALCGLIPIEAGTIHWAGQDIQRNLSGFQGEVAYLGHDAPLKHDLTGRENLFFAAGLRRRLRPFEIDAALEGAAAASFGDRPVRSLSAGQRRRVAFAALTLIAAPLWLLDEPTTNLDADGQALVAAMIARHVGAGGVVVAATHQRLELPEGARVQVRLGGP